MEKMRHFLGSRPAVGMMQSVGGDSHHHPSLFPPPPGSSGEGLSQEVRDCYQGIEEFRSAMKNLDGAGTHLTESLAQLLRGTAYQGVGDQLSGTFREVYGSQSLRRLLEQLKEMEVMLLGLELPSDRSHDDLQMMCAQTSCQVLLLFAKVQKQYFQVCYAKLVDLIQQLLAAKNAHRSAEVTKFVLKLGLGEEVGPDGKAIASLPNTPWGSPKLPKASQPHPQGKSQGRGAGFKLFSLFERKLSPEEGKSAFYVSMPDSEMEAGVGVADQPPPPPPPQQPLLPPQQPHPPQLVEMSSQPLTAGSLDAMATGSAASTTPEGSLLASVPLVTRTDEMNNECTPEFTLEDSAGSHLASEEDIDSVINLLSGVSCTSPLPSPTAPPTPTSMLSIPEDHTSPSSPNSLHSGPELASSRSPMQLTVPSLYRMRSPASDTQVDELQHPRLQAQLHRRSEGCLDLSGVGRNTWPHPHHHRASLPAVQLHPPYRFTFDPLPEPPPPPSRRFFGQDFMLPSQPPPGYLGSGCSRGGGMSGGGMMSGHPWPSSYSVGGGGGCGGGSGGGGGMDMRGSGTWPLYQPVSMPLGDSLNSSWSGAQDGSDGSDDSSNGDHFFAVGKDLVNAIDSRHESSDDEAEGGRSKSHKDFFDYDRQAGSTNTWPMMQHLPGPGLHFPPAAEYPDMADPPPLPPHRPLQMQWSDPVASHNIWSAANQGVGSHKGGPGVQPPPGNAPSMHGFGRIN